MQTDFIPFALPDIGDEEISAVVEALRSGWVTTGPLTRDFEQSFVHFMGGGVEAISVNSATAGLHLALEAVGVKAGDEVITTTHTFTATAEVIRYLGADPVFVDIDKDTLNMNASEIEKKITPKTKAIIPVHFAGLACDMGEILRIAKKHSLKVVEDAAHALPTTYDGRLIGTLGSDATVFSFYATKTMTTGEGGMIVTSSASLASRCKVMRLHGISRDAFDRYTSRTPSWYYEVVAPGYKYNLTDIASAIGIQQLKKVRAFQEKRMQIASYYSENLQGLPLELPAMSVDDASHAWHLYVVKIKPGSGIERNEFIKRMSEAGVSCSVHFIPLHLHPYWRETYSLLPQDFPVSTAVYESSVSLPIYSKMGSKDASRVVEAVKKIFGSF